MRVLDTFATILVLGILSFTIAQEEVTSEDGSNGGVTEGSDIPDSNSSTIFGISVEELASSLSEECEENGGPTAIDALSDGWHSAVNCTEPVVNLLEFETDRKTAASDRKWDAFAKKYCGKLPTILQCVDPFLSSFKTCLDPDNREIFGDYLNISSSFLEFICQNDGSRITSFYTNGGKECVGSKQLSFRQDCLLDVSSNRTQVADIAVPFWVDLGLKECADIERIGTCTVAVMRTCENQAPADVVESIVQFYKTRKSCPTIPAAEASPPTLSGTREAMVPRIG